MYVVALASQKGGSGKTTLSGHLAVEAERAGFGPVALIDTDPQASLAEWWNVRDAERPFFAKVSLAELPHALEELEEAGVRLAMIDTPPAITDSISRVIAFADLVLVPTRPSPHDLRAVGATVDIAERHGKPLLFVINAATARARITGEAAVALSQHGTVAPVMLHQRVDFAASMVDGRTVGEVTPQSASAKEVAALWTYVQDRLARIAHDSRLRPVHAAELALTPLSAMEPERGPISVQAASFREPEQEECLQSGSAPDHAPSPEATHEFVAEPPPPPPAPPPPFPQDAHAEPAGEMFVESAGDDHSAPAMTSSEAHEPVPGDRRGSPERRKYPPFAKPFGAVERRVHPFGRRHTDGTVPYTSAK
jgi:chromosome partitioning protein